MSLIQQYCTSEYTNARDKAYALLSLTTGPNGRDRLRFDYSLSIVEVYWDVIYFGLSLNHSIHYIAVMTLGGFVEPDMDFQRPESFYLSTLKQIPDAHDIPLGSVITLQLFSAARSSTFAILTTNLVIGEWSSRLLEDDLVCTLTVNRVAIVVRKFHEGCLMVGAAMLDIG